MKDIYAAIYKDQLRQTVFSAVKSDIIRGKKFFTTFNNSRLQTALQLFSPSMKAVLFEIIFLLHYNQPFLKKIPLYSTRSPKYKKPEYNNKNSHDLYINKAPAGVFGFANMPVSFLKEMRLHIKSEFNIDIKQLPPVDKSAITCISSLGSIGTIAYKSNESDLDLQVQYDLTPFIFDKEHLNHKFIVSSLANLQDYIKTKFHNDEKKIAFWQNKTSRLATAIDKKFNITNYNDYLGLCSELCHVLDLNVNLLKKVEIKKLDYFFQQRVKNIESYITSKYPEEEVHFFVYSTAIYRQGKHGSTLVSKESSGSAYEHILSFETLMPGIIFNGTFPTHFLFGSNINNNSILYKSIISCIRLGLFEDFLSNLNLTSELLVDLGNTPDLNKKYLLDHLGAVYWEAFKGSSGNLPKAFLNLLRLESLYFSEDKRQTIIQLIKRPNIFKSYFDNIKDKADKAKIRDPFGLEYDEKDPFSLDEIYRIELQNSDLLFDPWWLRYKMLKVYCENDLNLYYQQRQDISAMVDICFALHIGLIDVLYSDFVHIDDQQSTRTKVLSDFLENAFPALTEKRRFIEQIMQGEASAVTIFENNLKKLFKEAVNRILSDKLVSSSTQVSDEKMIWLRYYEQHFEPKEQQIPRNIISHFHKMNGRLKIIFDGQNWKFQSITTISERQRKMQAITEKDSFSQVVNLHVDADLICGMVYCIINKFYGAFANQAIKKSSSLLEINTNNFMGLSANDQKNAKVHSALLENISSKIALSFVPMEVDYLSAMSSKFSVANMIILVNVLVFGRVQAVYRDIMDIYYHLKIDNADFNQRSNLYQGKLDSILAEDCLHQSVLQIVKECSMDNLPTEQLISMITFWVNPLSFEKESNLKSEWLSELEKKIQKVFMDNLLVNLGRKKKQTI